MDTREDLRGCLGSSSRKILIKYAMINVFTFTGFIFYSCDKPHTAHNEHMENIENDKSLQIKLWFSNLKLVHKMDLMSYDWFPLYLLINFVVNNRYTK